MIMEMRDTQSDWLHLVTAAHEWERLNEFLDDRGQQNLALMRADLRLGPQKEARALLDLNTRHAAHSSATIGVEALRSRIHQVLQAFQLVGYDFHFAGHEGTLRQKIWRTAQCPWGMQLPANSLNSARLQSLVAFYFAYTDYCVSNDANDWSWARK
jgi:hypothetical protein